MNQRNKFLQFAISQLGTKGGDAYRKWYNSDVVNIGDYNWPWCAAGISYCAYKTGIARNIISPTASSSAMLHNFQRLGRFKRRGSYTPKGGDIIIFKWSNNTTTDASHVGIVEYSEGGYVHTIEFNSGSEADGEVARWKHKLTNTTIVGYCVPAFKNTKTEINQKGYIRSKAWLDPKYKSSKPLKAVKKGDKVTVIEDDMYGWSKVKYGTITGYIQNSRLDEANLSKYPVAMLKKSKKLKAVKDTSKKTIPANKKVTFICSIETGKNKGKSIISYKNKAYYVSTSNLKNITKRK